jgi:hypothetical protein
MIDGLLCLPVRRRRPAAIVRLSAGIGEGERGERLEARLVMLSRTEDIDDSKVGIGAILDRSSPCQRCRALGS